jgi:hypothetical protein
LPILRSRYRYFLEIVNNFLRKKWGYLLVNRNNAAAALKKWKLKVERQTLIQLKATRSDNARELTTLLKQ